MFENFTVKQFEDAWFKKDHSLISAEDLKIIHAEYLDTSGLFLSDDFEKRSYVLHLNQRINYVQLFVEFQREFLKQFGKPFLRIQDLFTLKSNYGYVLKWKEDADDFESQLEKIELREEKFHSTLAEKLKEIEDDRKKKYPQAVDEPEEDLKKSRTSWIRMINSLSKIGYKIDKPITTVEELSLMIKQQMEEYDESLKNNSNGG